MKFNYFEVDFMRVGHTRCFVDAGFGLLRQMYRKADVDTVAQLVTVINSSAGINNTEEFCWNWHSWDSFFKDHFRPVKNIIAYQRFNFSSLKPAAVDMSMSDSQPDRSLKIVTSDPEDRDL